MERMEVFTDAWCDACCARLNASAEYRQAAATWEGTVVLVMTADAAHGIPGERAVWIDAHHGHCRDSRVATAADRASAAYVLQADAATWTRLLAGETDPVSAAMTGKLKLTKGNLMSLAKYAAAAREMLRAAGEVGGTFPASA
ncbi:SCP2 sterol-binding domain-containing protein [Longimicrobium sp.]|uniref:SCP2 sterol-binding domain-containing protein n=1 Tax=Longimicrobium sp. TaxID=2029185 RepID=UPI002E37ACC5|nr:SCP2 sterol-binding domain-containing protein [Longimicrobium sp.]HEX6039223.1 SCP2 sterol-binding domain-containing protein [Longimicrobium sp.]